MIITLQNASFLSTDMNIKHLWRQTLSSASVTWMPRILKSWTSCRLCTVPSLIMASWHNQLSFLSTNLFRSNILNASFISWICSSVNWSATLDMLSSLLTLYRNRFYIAHKHNVMLFVSPRQLAVCNRNNCNHFHSASEAPGSYFSNGYRKQP